jgi:CBS domain containing-hemolysin-like protein
VRRGEELIGYLHIKDVLEFEDRHRNRPIAESWIRALADVSDTDSLREVLAALQRARAHMGRVRDASGAVLGVVALEDVLEELVGEIRDEARAAGRASAG